MGLFWATAVSFFWFMDHLQPGREGGKRIFLKVLTYGWIITGGLGSVLKTGFNLEAVRKIKCVFLKRYFLAMKKTDMFPDHEICPLSVDEEDVLYVQGRFPTLGPAPHLPSSPRATVIPVAEEVPGTHSNPHHIPLGAPHDADIFWRRSILLGVTVTVFWILITGRDLKTKE